MSRNYSTNEHLNGQPPFQAQVGEIRMVNNCANPQCAKPLHYLREGRVFVFEMSNKITDITTGEKRARRLEHFWLCGECSQVYEVQKAEAGIQLAPRRMVGQRKESILDKALAS